MDDCVNRSSATVTTESSCVGAGAFRCVGAVLFHGSASTSGGLGRMSDVTDALAEGDHSVEIEGAKNTNEIGQMAQAVQVFQDNAIETLGLEKAVEEQRTLQAKQDEDAHK